jgi:enoyl-CoA hydratase/carnithine racemase
MAPQVAHRRVGVTGASVGSRPVDLHDLGDLAGGAGELAIAGASVLEQAEPLVLHVAEPPPDPLVAEVAGLLRRAPTVVVLVADPAVVPPALVAAVDIALVAPARRRRSHAGDGPPGGDTDGTPPSWHTGALDLVRRRVAEQPLAGLALVSLLRVTEHLPVWDAVAAEAATYGMLLAGEAHRRWLRTRPAQSPTPVSGAGAARPPVDVRRVGDRLVVALDRPTVHNAVDTALRDHLVAALDVASADPSIREVDLRGHGPSFSAGGDIGEFGTVGDPAISHAVRLTRHPGLAVHRVAPRTTARVHGHCIGAGIEIPAFAGHVVADPATRLGLPELGMGVVPGAGGTVSVSRRIGRHRTAWLALTGEVVDAATALRWGLVDEIVPRSDWPAPAIA